MSETVHYKGTLTKVDLEGLTIEEFAKKTVGEGNLEQWCDSYAEQLMDDDEYMIRNGDLYKIDSEEVDTDYDIFNMNEAPDKTLKFEVMYYNGGCGFTEALNEAFERMESEKDE
jgi:hypothetical protein